MKKQTYNIEDLRADLITNMRRVKRSDADCRRAHEVAYTAGKILKTVSVQLQYASINKTKADIDFLKTK